MVQHKHSPRHKKRPKHRAKKASKLAHAAVLLMKCSLVAVVILLACCVYLDAWLMERFEGRKWAVPASVYARPLELFEGKVVDRALLLRELKAIGFHNRELQQPYSYQFNNNRLQLHIPSFTYWDGQEPAQKVQMSFNDQQISALQASSPLLRLPPMKIGSMHPGKHEDRVLISIHDVPQSLIDALLITEDRYFYGHWGLSPKAIARALLANVQSGRVVEGGSTLSQ